MSLSDCPRCWETPCKCGYEYKQYYPDSESMTKFIVDILGFRSKEELEEIRCQLNEELKKKISIENENSEKTKTR